jgi:hypothetical protein
MIAEPEIGINCPRICSCAAWLKGAAGAGDFPNPRVSYLMTRQREGSLSRTGSQIDESPQPG